MDKNQQQKCTAADAKLRLKWSRAEACVSFNHSSPEVVYFHPVKAAMPLFCFANPGHAAVSVFVTLLELAPTTPFLLPCNPTLRTGSHDLMLLPAANPPAAVNQSGKIVEPAMYHFQRDDNNPCVRVLGKFELQGTS